MLLSDIALWYCSRNLPVLRRARLERPALGFQAAGTRVHHLEGVTTAAGLDIGVWHNPSIYHCCLTTSIARSATTRNNGNLLLRIKQPLESGTNAPAGFLYI